MGPGTSSPKRGRQRRRAAFMMKRDVSNRSRRRGTVRRGMARHGRMRSARDCCSPRPMPTAVPSGRTIRRTDCRVARSRPPAPGVNSSTTLRAASVPRGRTTDGWMRSSGTTPSVVCRPSPPWSFASPGRFPTAASQRTKRHPSASRRFVGSARSTVTDGSSVSASGTGGGSQSPMMVSDGLRE